MQKKLRAKTLSFFTFCAFSLKTDVSSCTSKNHFINYIFEKGFGKFCRMYSSVKTLNFHSNYSVNELL